MLRVRCPEVVRGWVAVRQEEKTALGWGALLAIASALALSGCGLASDADDKIYFGALRQPEALEHQYLDLAIEIDSTKPCFLIARDSVVRAGFNSVGNQVSYLRSRCLAQVAAHTADASLCAQVRSVSTLFYSGAKLDRVNCRRNAAASGGRISSSLDVPSMVALAGYDETAVNAHLVSEGRFSSEEVAARWRLDAPGRYWDEVRRHLLHSEQFFRRIEELPGYGDSADLARMGSVAWQPRYIRPFPPLEQRRREMPQHGIRAESR